MATTDLGKWMITNGGEYNPDTTYEQLTMVLYQNSTYITLRTVTGIIPNNDKINYILMAQGFSANALADVVAKDTYGVIGDVSGDVSAQNLVDYLTNEVVNNLLKKTSISTVQTNSDNTVPSSSLAYAMQQEITKNKEDIATANSNFTTDYLALNTLFSQPISETDVCYVMRYGHIVFLKLTVKFAQALAGTTTWLILPEQFRPKYYVKAPATLFKNGLPTGDTVSILVNGEIKTDSGADSGAWNFVYTSYYVE